MLLPTPHLQPLVMERKNIQKLFKQLDKRARQPFPKSRQHLEAPATHGVYVIRDSAHAVLHVGRTYRGLNGLSQRLYNHLRGQSSFVQVYLQDHGRELRDGYTFQYLEVPDNRVRALLEHFATAWHCPKHLGVGVLRKNAKSNGTKRKAISH